MNRECSRAEEQFDLITGSPPYFPPDAGVQSEHPQRLACRFELRGTVADYCAAAARHLAPAVSSRVCFPIEPAQLARLEAGAKDAGLVIVRKRPVIFREGEPPLDWFVRPDARGRFAGVVSRADLGRTAADHPHARRGDSPGVFRGETGHRFSALKESLARKVTNPIPQ